MNRPILLMSLTNDSFFEKYLTSLMPLYLRNCKDINQPNRCSWRRTRPGACRARKSRSTEKGHSQSRLLKIGISKKNYLACLGKKASRKRTTSSIAELSSKLGNYSWYDLQWTCQNWDLIFTDNNPVRAENWRDFDTKINNGR